MHEEKEGKHYIQVEPMRTPENERTNAYCRLLLQLTRCNQDMKLIIDPEMCYHYLLKYVTKEELPTP